MLPEELFHCGRKREGALGLVACIGRIVSGGDLTQQLLGFGPRLIGGQHAVAANRDAARAALPPAKAVLDQVGLSASGRDLETEPRQFIVPEIAVGSFRPGRIDCALRDPELATANLPVST